MSAPTFRITRKGILAFALMPRLHGKRLEKAVERICKDGPRGKLELAAVLDANAADVPDPKIAAEWSEK